jgi:hypothetical protein
VRVLGEEPGLGLPNQHTKACPRFQTTHCWCPPPNRETNEARGGGSCTGPVEVNRGPLMTSGTLYRLGPPSHFPPSAFLTLGTASSFLSGGRNRGAEILKAPLHPSHRLCTRPQNGGPNREMNEARGGGSCRGRSKRIVGPT